MAQKVKPFPGLGRAQKDLKINGQPVQKYGQHAEAK